MTIVHYCTTIRPMSGAQFIKAVRKAGRKNGISVRFEPGRGKGSHGRPYYGARFTTVKDRKKEIGAGLYHAMLGQLGINSNDIQ